MVVTSLAKHLHTLDEQSCKRTEHLARFFEQSLKSMREFANGTRDLVYQTQRDLKSTTEKVEALEKQVAVQRPAVTIYLAPASITERLSPAGGLSIVPV